MQKLGLMAGILGMLVGAAQAQDYVLKHEFRAVLNGNEAAPGAGGVALADNGDLYFVTFQDVNSKLIYCPNAVSDMLAGTTPTRTLVLTESSAPDSKALENLRGYNDVEVDSSGNVYIVGTGSSAATTVLRKVGPAPAHTVAWTAAAADRYQGVAVVSPTKLIATGFSYLAEINAADGTNSKLSATTGSVYQRSLAFNPATSDLYAGRNGGSNNDSLVVYSGGTPAAPATYTVANANAIADIGVGSQYGIATQAVDFDPNNNQLIAADQNDTNHTAAGIRVYNVSGTGAGATFTEAQYIDGVGAPRWAAYFSVNGVAYRRVNGKDYIAAYGTKGNDVVISLYERTNAAVADWSLYNE